jgi:hypothetical protein
LWSGSSGGGAEVRHAEVGDGVLGRDLAHGLEFPVGGGDAGLDRGDFAEPAVFLGLLEAVE